MLVKRHSSCYYSFYVLLIVNEGGLDDMQAGWARRARCRPLGTSNTKCSHPAALLRIPFRPLHLA